jgi:hypothetical protein
MQDSDFGKLFLAKSLATQEQLPRPRKRQIRQERIWSALADPKGEAQGWASQRNSPSGTINPINTTVALAILLLNLY